MEKDGFDGNLRDKGHFQVHGWGGEDGPNKKTSLPIAQRWQHVDLVCSENVHREEWRTCRAGNEPVQ